MNLAIYLVASLFSCVTGWIMSEKEDKRYKLNNKEKVTTVVVSLICALGIYLEQGDNVSISLLIWPILALGLLSTSLIIDFKLKELPDTLTFFSIGLAIPFVYFLYSPDRFDKIVPVLVTLGVLEIFLYILWKISGKIGFGDLKLFIPVLLFLPYQWLADYWINTLLAAVVVSIIQLIKTKDRNLQIAFGPYIIIGLISVYFGLSIYNFF